MEITPFTIMQPILIRVLLSSTKNMEVAGSRSS